MRRVAVLLCLTLAACNGGTNGGVNGSAVPQCSMPPAIPSPTDLPPTFPTPDGVAYTSSEKAGPSTILEGHWIDATLEDAFQAYRAAFPEAGYQVTDEEQEATDAEVNFAGHETSGQVRLNSRTCAGVVTIGITIRPA